MLRLLPMIVEVGLLVFCLIECIQADSALVRNLNKTLWVFLIILVPIIGSVAWLVAGRPQGNQRARSVPWPSTATAGFPEYERPRPPRGPDDDVDFLQGLRGPDRDHEKMLADWEATLRDREQKLASGSTGGSGSTDAAASPGSPGAVADVPHVEAGSGPVQDQPGPAPQG